MKKLKKTKPSVAKRAAKRSALLEAPTVTRSDVERIKLILETLELVGRLNRQGSRERKQILSSIEQRLLSGLAFAKDGSLRPLDKTPSGASWVSEFPDSKSTADLVSPFGGGVDSFIAAMTDAGTSVTIGTTLRPPKRAYLMYNAWRIAKAEVKAADVDPMDGVDIEWVHSTDAKSISAAQEMVDGYLIRAKPALNSRHTLGRAIDMTISWTGKLSIKNKDGTAVEITSSPRNGENSDLDAVGATYGVIKATFAGDPPHWSDNGH
jgi:hypothetical protein